MNICFELLRDNIIGNKLNALLNLYDYSITISNLRLSMSIEANMNIFNIKKYIVMGENIISIINKTLQYIKLQLILERY